MHRKIKKQILEIMESIEEALQYMKRAQEADCRAMAEDCRMCTKTIADALDAEKQAEQDALSALARFDQMLDASLAFLAKRERWLFKLSALQKQLIDVKRRIQEIKAKIEVVFLPYKASMADSLESIWESAVADPNCNVIICPIPYFERLPNGALGKMYYEGNAYSKALPLVDWQEYNIEAHHPDIIFIHSPYDEGNYVTSIHPDFYSRRLRKCTDMLVYVPYFVVLENVPEHFCITAGCIYAHKVIVQSKETCSTYIRAFKETYGNRFGEPEEKFIPIGSPKFDKIVNINRKDYELPEEWSKLIVGKKVILYNTSIGAMLTGNEQYLIKLQGVLNKFRECNNVILWWRPHPLSESTLNSMRPDLANVYKEIVRKYIQEAYGIYDDTSNLYRSIAWSDAYYGDVGSIVVLYQATGKPILIQDIKKNSDFDLSNTSIASENFFDDGKYLWFSAMDFNALFRMDKRTWIPEYIGSFPGANIAKERINSCLTCHNNKLYFAPFNGENFYVYDLNNKAFDKLNIPDCLINPVRKGQFISIVVYKQYIFYIGYTFRGILRLDSKRGEIKCYDNWAYEIDKLTGEREKLYFVYVQAINNKLYCPCIFAKAVLIFNMDTCGYEIIELESKVEGFNSIAYDGKSFWLASGFDNSFLIEWNERNGKVIEHENPRNLNDGLWTVASANRSAWFIPYSSNNSFKANNHEIEYVDELCDMFPDKDGSEWTARTVVCDTIYLHKNIKYNNSIVIFDTVTKKLCEKKIKLNNEQLRKINSSLKKVFVDRIKHIETWRDYMIHETLVFNLSAYIDFISNEFDIVDTELVYSKMIELYKETTGNLEGTAGKSIYNYMKIVLEEGVV